MGDLKRRKGKEVWYNYTIITLIVTINISQFRWRSLPLHLLHFSLTHNVFKVGSLLSCNVFRFIINLCKRILLSIPVYSNTTGRRKVCLWAWLMMRYSMTVFQSTLVARWKHTLYPLDSFWFIFVISLWHCGQPLTGGEAINVDLMTKTYTYLSPLSSVAREAGLEWVGRIILNVAVKVFGGSVLPRGREVTLFPGWSLLLLKSIPCSFSRSLFSPCLSVQTVFASDIYYLSVLPVCFFSSIRLDHGLWCFLSLYMFFS